MENNRSTFDFPLFFASLALFLIGIACVYSATYIQTSGPLYKIYQKQVIWLIMGVSIMLAIVSIPGRFYYYFSYFFYAAAVLFLVYALVTGIVSKGAGRWVNIAGIQLQPSEFAKIGLMFALARYLSKNEVSLSKITSFIIPGILILTPFVLVLKQPDLGTAMIFCLMSIPMFFWTGMSILEIFFLTSPGISVVLSAIPLILAFDTNIHLGIGGTVPWGIFFVILCVILYITRPPVYLIIIIIFINLVTATSTTILWNTLLKDYQKTRIISFIDPQKDAFGSGYQVIQSKIAMGSGHIFGKGYLQGTQTKLLYLPEQHTDFIFSVYGEQFGFIGSIVVLFLFIFVIIRALATTHHVKNRFTNLVIVGCTSIIGFHILINIAMITGMMPVAGIPLPFLSYGGSFTITTAILIGFIFNARTTSQDY